MKAIFRVLLVVSMLAFAISALAQSNELAITAGGDFPRNNTFDSGTSLAVGASFAHRVVHLPLASIYWELPVVVAPKSVARVPSSTNYSSLFFTPSLKLKLAPEFPVSPYFVAGGGFARFKEDTTNNSHTTGVFSYGAGLDMKFFPYLSWRFEARDYYTGSPSLSAIGDTGRQHNIVAQTGVVFRF
jgi:opacity protein-like surface antigen